MFAKKRIRGEPFKCAGGLPVTSYAHAPTIFAVSCKQKLKCLVDTGCTKSIVAAKTAKRLNVAMSACNERISLMNGSLTPCTSFCSIKIDVSHVALTADCLVSDLLGDYDLILGMDIITQLGGLIIDKNGNVNFNSNNSACAVSCVVDDVDFDVQFVDRKWTVKWKWKLDSAPQLSNHIAQYKVKDSAAPQYEKEVKDWIARGWLQKFDGDHDGIVPLMAVVQPNKGKVRPVLDFRELNQYVSSHTAESEVCSSKLRLWRKLGNNLAVIDLSKAYLQIHVHPDLFKFQVVIFQGQKYCLTRLGFGLNSAPKIMASILKKIFSLEPKVKDAVDSYVDDIIVNLDKITCEEVVDLLTRFGLEAKTPEVLNGARILGLKVNKSGDDFVWKRDNVVDFNTDISTRRELFSFCGKLIGHFPIARWLRPACSYVKRLCNGLRWDEELTDAIKVIIGKLKERLRVSDPVGGKWAVPKNDKARIWCDASSIAIGAVVEVGGRIIEDACWLRKEHDPLHINVAELESVIKGLSLVMEWGFKDINICTDSSSVYAWVSSILTRDKPIRVSGLSSVLIKRRAELIKSFVDELGLHLTISQVRSEENKADELTRVPQNWLKIKNSCAVSSFAIDDGEAIRKSHDLHHMGAEKTLYFFKRQNPGVEVSLEKVRDAIRVCEKCATIDPNPIMVENGALDVKNNWHRLACDVTHFKNSKYFTIIDCGPSRYAIWKPICSESSSELTGIVEVIFREMGPPNELLLDNYSSFKSARFLDMCRKWSVSVVFRCAYKPSGNGIIERNHRTIKRLAARCDEDLLDVVYMYNLTPRNKDGISPSSRMFCQPWRWFKNEHEIKICDNDIFSSFSVGDSVYVKPADSRCTSVWSRGIVTKVNSKWNIEVDGVPRHVRDLRRTVNSPLNDQTVSHSDNGTADEVQLRR